MYFFKAMQKLSVIIVCKPATISYKNVRCVQEKNSKSSKSVINTFISALLLINGMCHFTNTFSSEGKRLENYLERKKILSKRKTLMLRKNEEMRKLKLHCEIIV